MGGAVAGAVSAAAAEGGGDGGDAVAVAGGGAGACALARAVKSMSAAQIHRETLTTGRHRIASVPCRSTGARPPPAVRPERLSPSGGEEKNTPIPFVELMTTFLSNRVHFAPASADIERELRQGDMGKLRSLPYASNQGFSLSLGQMRRERDRQPKPAATFRRTGDRCDA
jgi:hypothetical protein